MGQTTLKVLLSDWTDWDGAAYSLGISLGLIPDAQGRGAPKGVLEQSSDWDDALCHIGRVG